VALSVGLPRPGVTRHRRLVESGLSSKLNYSATTQSPAYSLRLIASHDFVNIYWLLSYGPAKGARIPSTSKAITIRVNSKLIFFGTPSSQKSFLCGTIRYISITITLEATLGLKAALINSGPNWIISYECILNDIRYICSRSSGNVRGVN